MIKSVLITLFLLGLQVFPANAGDDKNTFILNDGYGNQVIIRSKLSRERGAQVFGTKSGRRTIIIPSKRNVIVLGRRAYDASYTKYIKQNRRETRKKQRQATRTARDLGYILGRHIDDDRNTGRIIIIP